MIKNKLKLGSILAALLVAGCLSASSVLASNLNYDAATNITLANGVTMTISAGSDATSLVINDNSTVDVVVPAGTSDNVFTVTLPNIVTFSGSGGAGTTATQSCSGSTNTAVITAAAAVAATYTITTTGGVCAASSGGGGGGGTSDTTPPTNTSIVIAGGAATTSSVNVTLTLAATDATNMQISNDSAFTGASWETYATSKAWALTNGDGTKTVYAKFRDASLNVSASVSDTITLSGSGTVAPPSPPPAPPAPVPPGSQAAVIAQLQAQINALILQINALIAAQGGVPSSICPTRLTVQLSLGMRHAQVTCLQNFLKANGYMSASIQSTGYFGTLTRAAVQAFQAQKGIASAGVYGYGHLGPKTRAAINAMLGF